MFLPISSLESIRISFSAHSKRLLHSVTEKFQMVNNSRLKSRVLTAQTNKTTPSYLLEKRYYTAYMMLGYFTLGLG